MSVSIDKSIDRLKTFKDSPAPILSIYFQLPVPKKYTNETIVNKLQTHINAALTMEQREEMKKNIQMIVGFIGKYQQSRGEKTIVFFSGDDNLFEVLHLPYKMESSVTYAHEPNLQPLLEEQSDVRRYLVILSDKKNAIYYTVSGGSVEEKEQLFDDQVPQDINHIGSWGLRTQRDDKTQRHVHEHMQKHIGYVMERIQKFIQNKPIAGVILGGHKNELSRFREKLPSNLRDKVVGDFVSELHTNFNDIVEKSKRVIDRANKQFVQQMSPA